MSDLLVVTVTVTDDDDRQSTRVDPTDQLRLRAARCALRPSHQLYIL